jgi:hypothetical protein
MLKQEMNVKKVSAKRGEELILSVHCYQKQGLQMSNNQRVSNMVICHRLQHIQALCLLLTK